MTRREGARALTAAAAEAFVRDWHTALCAGAPAAELVPYLANGLRLELPHHVVRGAEEFTAWHTAGQRLPLTGGDFAVTPLEVHLSSPVHAEVSCALPGGPGRAPVRQTWWLVLQQGTPRLRTLTVHPEPATAPAAAPRPAAATAPAATAPTAPETAVATLPPAAQPALAGA
ncbi:hypothetical protein [Streptomyces sp. PsTaAH-124]|uniref:hypothetical protein n=1 Tax=Streptomyces sp. PsTaAH-124 TaxID=1157638 RepID=UPI0003A44262|nr:hypothetical protein [Streptomyces sp. PsTaAH-124]